MLDARCWILDAGYWILMGLPACRNGVEVGMSRNAGFRFAQLDTRYSILGFGI
jgi:hypothetical protein